MDSLSLIYYGQQLNEAAQHTEHIRKRELNLVYLLINNQLKLHNYELRMGIYFIYR